MPTSPDAPPPNGPAATAVYWLGTVPYHEAWLLQQTLLAEIYRGSQPETLLMLEHPPVITLGRRKEARQNVLDAGDVDVVEVERGGDATYHAPGQLVCYPLLALAPHERDLHRFLRNLEQAVIDTLLELNLQTGRRDGFSGVWYRERKLASVGVAVKHWVTYHGIALNVSNDVSAFQRLHPCGLAADVMASVADFLVQPPPTCETLASRFALAFSRAFARELHWVSGHPCQGGTA
ncbi:MAG: lipoyl(octanoyl) transferase LipB [Candidatus Sericytochromatia bacterium]|nr:lipoyl(octanoyl) transferase LipB [Candidatus Sericytochromatia bacterium]